MASSSSQSLLVIAGLASLDLAEETPSREFHLFGSLPPELRAEIWRLAALQPAVAARVFNRETLTGSHLRGPDLYQRIMRSDVAFDLYRPVPAVLHVCRESRTELLDAASAAGNQRGSREGQLEMLYLTREHKKRGRGYLAMAWGLPSSWNCVPDRRAAVRFVRNFPRLRKLTLLVRIMVYNELPHGEPGRRHRKQTQKRLALRTILSDVSHAIEAGTSEQQQQQQQQQQPTAADRGGKTGTKLKVCVVAKTRAWEPPRVKAWRPLPVTWVQPERNVVLRVSGREELGERKKDGWAYSWYYPHLRHMRPAFEP
ncbi:hypothetical protein CTA2_10278 [Colletotrichum tanaceti]|uniref:2EXR domain-containing protein n=1 Tax=Colletotrichum tanaceti TaxID=1306861 RepID=A0A4U6XER1_9PEZI|nr:hypothetical protein CTA2_10278 [Colletotrichum tanaceti]TKW53779.1 hypothetical protein CTA1_1206 [Colletotrichum tanaceti]